MKKVASVVYNSVLHDARVIKEAESLKSAGYNVKIFGIQDGKYEGSFHKTPGGVDVVLVDWKKSSNMRIKSSLFCLFIAFFILFLSIGSVLDLAYESEYSVGILYLLVFLGMILNVGILLVALKFGATHFKRLINIKDKNHFLWKIDFLDNSVRFLYLLSRFSQFKRAVFVEIVKFKPEIIHCHDLHAMGLGVLTKKKVGSTLIYDSHEVYTELSHSTLIRKIFFSIYEFIVAPKVDGFITVNDSIATYLNKRYPSLPKAVVVKNATKLNGAGVIQYDGRLHQAADLEVDRKILLYQGGYANHRGLQALLKSAPLLPEDWCVVFMGWGRIEEGLRELAHKVNPDGSRIRFVPPAPYSELAQWSAGASLGVVPYENVSLNHFYCSPNKLWEYPVSGVPILASPFPELKKVIEEYEMGWFVDDPLTPEHIARVVSCLSEWDLEQARRGCEKFMVADHWGKYEKRLFDLYSYLATQAS